jgi:hypothetical protein
MSNSLSQDLRTDYCSNNGNHHLLIDRNPGLSEKDFISIQVHMLQNNIIPRLLHVEFENVDHNIRLLYEIGGKKMLAHRLKRERLTQEQYLRMMLHTVSLLADCPGYMLDSEKIMLDKNYIFTGRDITDLSFTYIPLKLYVGKRTIHEQLREFSSHCMASVHTMEGDRIPQVLAFLRDETIRFAEMKEWLLTLALADSDCSIDVNQPTMPELVESAAPTLLPPRPSWISHDLPTPNLFPTQTPQLTATKTAHSPTNHSPLTRPTSDEKQSSPSMTVKGPAAWLKRIRELKDEVGPSSDTGELPMPLSNPHSKTVHTRPIRRMAFLLVASLALICFIWSFYTDASSKTAFILLLTGSLIIVASTVTVFRARPSWLYGEVQQNQRTETDENENDDNNEYIWSARSWTPKSPQSPSPATTSLPTDKSSLPVHKPLTLDPDKSDGVSPPPNHLATVLLNSSILESVNEIVAPVRYPSLEIVDHSGSTTTIAIDKDSLIIGREDAGVDFSLSGNGVSKHHLEIVKREGEYYAQDLGSTNGTTWNGERMVPYKAYSLKNGDKLCIIQTQFVFKKE